MSTGSKRRSRNQKSPEAQLFDDLLQDFAKAIKSKGADLIDDAVDYIRASQTATAIQSEPERPDPYLVLGLEPDASLQDVKQAFRDWVKANRPDLGQHKEEFLRIRSAYDEITGGPT